MYINGSYMYDSDRSLAPKTGFSGTGFPVIIRTILRRVRQLELMNFNMCLFFINTY